MKKHIIKKSIKLIAAVLIWVLYETVFDGSGIGTKEHLIKIRDWVEKGF